MSITASIIADSKPTEDNGGPRLVTFELYYPRFIHAEVMTHAMFSRNASSSRAIPTRKMHRNINTDPALPHEWRMNEPGMQGFTKASPEVKEAAERIMQRAKMTAIMYAEELDALGLHKQHVNRLTEPFQHIRVVLTSVYWDNFFGLRCHPAAEPTMQALATSMREAMEDSYPVTLERGQWHLPYVGHSTKVEVENYVFNLPPGMLAFDASKRDAIKAICQKVSVARCARVSYNNFEGRASSIEEDIELFEKLVGSAPIHASPACHQATPDWKVTEPGNRNYGKYRHPKLQGNLHGWIQLRKTLPHENLDKVIDGIYPTRTFKY